MIARACHAALEAKQGSDLVQNDEEEELTHEEETSI